MPKEKQKPLLKIKTAEADGIKLLKEAKADAAVLQLKSYETLGRVADGNATKIIYQRNYQTLQPLEQYFKKAYNMTIDIRIEKLRKEGESNLSFF